MAPDGGLLPIAGARAEAIGYQRFEVALAGTATLGAAVLRDLIS